MTEKQIADVSIIVPNYNNGRYLEEFIQSVLNSTIQPARLIIVDDGSTDNSRELLNSYNDLKFLKAIFFETNRGLTAALNKALEYAESKYIMRADPDDLLHPEKIERQLSFMEKHPEVDVLGCNVLYFSEKRKSINVSNFPTEHHEIVRTFKKGGHGVQHPTVFVRGEVYRNYRYQPLFPGEDYEILARMVRDGCVFAGLKDVLYFMRIHPESIVSSLKFEGIKQTFQFRDEIFGTKTSRLRVMLYYWYIKNYRKFQITDNPIAAYFSLALAIMMNPSKILKRFFKR